MGYHYAMAKNAPLHHVRNPVGPVPRIQRAALYTRVSTDLQVERESLAGQKTALREFAETEGYSVVAEYEDAGISGSKSEDARPGLRRMMADAERGAFDVVLVFRLDRLARNVMLIHHLIAKLQENKVHFASREDRLIDTRGSMAGVMIPMMAFFAANERTATVERFTAGLRAAVARGKYSGGIVAYGYKVEDGRLMEEPEEAKVVRKIFDLCANHGWSSVRIAKQLADEGIPTKYKLEGRGVRGKATADVWTAGNVGRMTRNRTYTGVYEYGKRTARTGEQKLPLVLGSAPRLISDETFERAAEVRVKNRLLAMRNAKNIYMLKSLIKCAACRRSYVGHKGDKVNRYVCTGRNLRGGQPDAMKCFNPSVRAGELEDSVWRELSGFIRNPGEALERLRQERQAQPDRTAEIEEARKSLIKLEGEQQRLGNMYQKGRVSETQYDADYDKLQFRINAVQDALTRLSDVDRQEAERQAAEAHFHALSARLKDRLDRLDDRERQQLAYELVRRITVAPDGDVKVEYRF